jgi:hypothetical protein
VFWGLVELLIFPLRSGAIAEFYALWITLFLAINIFWDIFSKRTEAFHPGHLSEKVDTLFSATTFASSLFLLLTLFHADELKFSGGEKVPLIIAGFSGVLVSVKYLCPYEIPERKKLPNGSKSDPSVKKL